MPWERMKREEARQAGQRHRKVVKRTGWKRKRRGIHKVLKGNKALYMFGLLFLTGSLLGKMLASMG